MDNTRVKCGKKNQNPHFHFLTPFCSKQSTKSIPKKGSNPQKNHDINRGVWKRKNSPEQPVNHQKVFTILWPAAFSTIC